MSVLAWIIVFSLIGGVLSVVSAGIFLLFPKKFRIQLLPHLVSFAIGALLGAAFLDLLPEALEGAAHLDPHAITATVLFGVLGFFLLEKIVLWRHCHSHPTPLDVSDPVHATATVHGHSHSRAEAAGTLIVIGDSIHNFVDGVLIAAAFMTDIRLGIVTSLAVAAHEIPQEVGDFAILLHSGFSRRKALFFNILSSFTTVVGGVLAYYSLAGLERVLPFVLAIAASSFIYIAVADLIPDLHQRAQGRATIHQFMLIALGVLVIYLTQSALH
ncbi:MAG: ZIP family metal transporter [Gammaproteobacteria bacterium]